VTDCKGPGSAAELAGLIVGGCTYNRDNSSRIIEFAARYEITETAAARILRDRGEIQAEGK
jgi:hypothetical protein